MAQCTLLIIHLAPRAAQPRECPVNMCFKFQVKNGRGCIGSGRFPGLNSNLSKPLYFGGLL